MTRANKAMAVFLVAAMGLWGCAQGPAGGPAGERIKTLESKCGKLEEDYRAVAAARDQLRKKTAEAEGQKARLQKELEQLQVLAREQEELKSQLNARTVERDTAQVQLEELRKGIRGLLGQADTATTTSHAAPAVTVSDDPANQS